MNALIEGLRFMAGLLRIFCRTPNLTTVDSSS